MSRLPLRTLDDAPDGAKKGLELSQKANGFLPNLVRLLANAPVALEAYQTLSAINARSGLRLAEREAVQITAAATHGCGFCVAGHTIVAYKRAGLSEDVVNALRNNDPRSGRAAERYRGVYARCHSQPGQRQRQRIEGVPGGRIYRCERAGSRAWCQPRDAVQFRQQSRPVRIKSGIPALCLDQPDRGRSRVIRSHAKTQSGNTPDQLEDVARRYGT